VAVRLPLAPTLRKTKMSNAICPTCGGKKTPYAKQCQQCHNEEVDRIADARHAELYKKGWNVKYAYYPEETMVCPECGGWKSPNAKMCKHCDAPRRAQMARQRWAECNEKRKDPTKHICPKCGGHKGDPRSAQCSKCYIKQRKAQDHRMLMARKRYDAA